MSHPSNPKTHTCCTCEYVWDHGQCGDHSCSDLLLQKIYELKTQLSEANAAIKFAHGHNLNYQFRDWYYKHHKVAIERALEESD